MSKNKNSPLTNLKEIASVFNEGSAEIKKQCLNNCSKIKLSTKKIIEQFHDCLIFLLGYPENEELFLLAQKEMDRLCASVEKLPKQKKSKK